jgi:hypothetical protein
MALRFSVFRNAALLSVWQELEHIPVKIQVECDGSHTKKMIAPQSISTYQNYLDCLNLSSIKNKITHYLEKNSDIITQTFK